MEVARCAMRHSRLPETFWDCVVSDATYEYNMLPHAAPGTIPQAAWNPTSPTTTTLVTLGAVRRVPTPDPPSKQKQCWRSMRTPLIIYIESNKTESPSSSPILMLRSYIAHFASAHRTATSTALTISTLLSLLATPPRHGPYYLLPHQHPPQHHKCDFYMTEDFALMRMPQSGTSRSTKGPLLTSHRRTHHATVDGSDSL